MKLKINCNEIFAEEISDECAYYLTHFFQNLALAFEAMHLFQTSRHASKRRKKTTQIEEKIHE